MRRQSEHMADYAAALGAADRDGPRLSGVPARAPRSPQRPPRRHGRAIPTARRSIPAPTAIFRAAEVERRIATGAPYALRLRMDRAVATAGPLSWKKKMKARIAADPAAWGDVIVARKETPTSYHLAVTVDDAAQGVTHVVRGRDLYHATSVHVLLQKLLGLPSPAYHHHRLIVDARRAQAGEVGPRHVAPFAARGGKDAGRHPADGRALAKPLHDVQPEGRR